MTIEQGFRPGDIGAIAGLHGRYYAAHWNMGPLFEAKVAEGLGAFAQRFDPASDLVLIARNGETFLGSLILDLNDPASRAHFGGASCAHLRFFVMEDEARGTGMGRAMLDAAIAHADANCEGRVWLTTFGGLDTARAMYERRGFRLTEEMEGTRWGFRLLDQTFERDGRQ